MGLIKLPILVLVVVIWTVLGLAFWIPLLARSIAVYASTVLLANIAGGSSEVAGHRLQLAVRFYADGFRNIIDSLYRTNGPRDDSGSSGLNLGRLLTEAVWTALFWIGVILVFKGILS